MKGQSCKFIIVDDEPSVRQLLARVITELGAEVIFSACDGEEGLAAIRRLCPDIVTTDICMPKMDGLRLAEMLNRDGYRGRLVMYSSCCNFESAQRAMACGATRFISKFSDVFELKRQLKEEIERHFEGLSKYAEAMPLLRGQLLDLLLDDKAEQAALDALGMIGVRLPASGTVIECALLSGEGGCLADLYETLLSGGGVGHRYERRFVFFSSNTDARVVAQLAEQFVSRLPSDCNCRVAIGISSAYGEAQSVASAFRQAHAIRRDYVFPAVHSINTSLSHDCSCRRKKVVDDALKEITENYASKLSIKKIAEILCVSESHLMHEFKETLGKTFNECLTEYRMIRARELLAENRYRINEVASLVGYSDSRHFGQIFKEATGMSPSEYAERCGRKVF